jgi:RNA polymerase sigma-70 factor (ECF subfamily)
MRLQIFSFAYTRYIRALQSGDSLSIAGNALWRRSMNDMGALLEPEIPPLRRYARALIGDAVRADDLVDDCLRRAVRTMDLFWSGTELRVWLFTILHDQLADDGRRAARGMPATAVADQVSTHKNRRSALALKDLQRALATLSDDQRRVVLLVGLEGFRYDDVARILDVPVGTVRSRLSRGLNTLRVVMTGDEKPCSSAAA